MQKRTHTMVPRAGKNQSIISQKHSFKDRSLTGFTLIECVMVMVIIGIIASVLIPKFGDLQETARIQATKAEMAELISAIAGNVDTQFHGFIPHMYRVPTGLSELVNTPADGAIDPVSGTGWYGPYVDDKDNDSNGTADSLEDAWGVDYGYATTDGAITITSTGGTDDIEVSFQYEGTGG
ncbi:MAG: prepilin-type N-terminal cleavage/methylation domain-containing protein [Candidatus Omnitrophica bacterium]|nr:prepilin-type N-terminal cleavage/methylation domain-containing protein [Candidatus Omnitrophota bacterium]